MYNKNIKTPTEKQVIGKIGEDYACEFLKDKGFKIVERNYFKKWGELDIIAKKRDKVHFVEVKTVSYVTNTTKNDEYRPEDNIHTWKIQRLARIIQSYLLERDVSDETDWQFDVISVYLDKNKHILKIESLEDIII